MGTCRGVVMHGARFALRGVAGLNEDRGASRFRVVVVLVGGLAMTKGTVILIGGVCVALAGQSAHALASAAPASASSAMGGIWLGMTCPCDGDMDGNGVIQMQDILFVIDCVNGVEPEPPQTCDAADIDCDGVVDLCDASRVHCQFIGMTDCCTNTACGACCNSGVGFEPCLVISEAFCHSELIKGDYLGNGTECHPDACAATECMTHDDCHDKNPCTADVCKEGTCVHDNLESGTPCSDESFCNGEETCHLGACQFGPPRSCDDALACTVDTCDKAKDACVHAPAECNNDGVCDSPCENADNCAGDCDGCHCVLDQDGNDLIQMQDVLNVALCADGKIPDPPLTCDSADLNCDGAVDYCDVSRVVCAFQGNLDCCEAKIACGACCNSGVAFEPCLVISEAFCHSELIKGDYLGNGTECHPDACAATECMTHDDCHDKNPCTADVCKEGTCVHDNLESGTPCSDESFCNGEETCHLGACQFGPPRSCDDALACTVDTCDKAKDACVHAPAECNNDGVCDSPCENADNCAGDCDGCHCVLDQDGNDLIQMQDVLNVALCADGKIPDPPLTCDSADLNCDGAVDYCDVSRVVCAFQGNLDCCEAKIACGACCNSGVAFEPCLVISEAFCHSELIKGDYLGNGTECHPDACAAPVVGACCFATECIELSAASCKAEGGEYVGDGTECHLAECGGHLVGACCLGVECVEASKEGCSGEGGEYLGDGTECHGESCAGVAPGACCIGDVCHELAGDVCHGEGGEFLGEGTACLPETCPVSTWQPRASGLRNRYLSVSVGDQTGLTAISVWFVDLPSPFDVFNGMNMWVGPPSDVSENGGTVQPIPGFPVFKSALLQCEPYITDWSLLGTVYVRHEDIVPAGIYQIQVVPGGSVAGAERRASDATEVVMSRWADVAAAFNTDAGHWGTPDGIVDVQTDVLAIVDKFAGRSTALSKTRIDLEPATPDLIISVMDMTLALDAFTGFAYPFSPGPAPCP